MLFKATRNIPAIQVGAGVPFTIGMHVSGTLAGSSSNIVSAFQVNPSASPRVFGRDRRREAFRIGQVQLFIPTVGTGTGGTTIKLCKNADLTNLLIATVTLTVTGAIIKGYANTAGVFDPSQPTLGYPVYDGDELDLYVTAVPGSTVPAYAQVQIVCAGFATDF